MLVAPFDFLLARRAAFVDIAPTWPDAIATVVLEIRLPRVVLAGLVGAGGGFLIVPALSLIGRLPLRQAGLLTRDPRMKERKKYGLKRARKAPQYTKR